MASVGTSSHGGVAFRKLLPRVYGGLCAVLPRARLQSTPRAAQPLAGWLHLPQRKAGKPSTIFELPFSIRTEISAAEYHAMADSMLDAVMVRACCPPHDHKDF